MATKATINLYKNTGFNGVNVPYSPSDLPTPAKTLSNYMYLNSAQNATTIRLAGADDWMEYDYISITGDTWGGFSTCYYWVSGYDILTNQEVEYTLIPDWITTIGGMAVLGNAIEDGMVSRIPKEDALARAATGGLNIIEDSGFTPSQPLRVLFQNDTTDDIAASTGSFTDDELIIASTIDLADASRVAQTFTDSLNNLNVTVPTCPPVSSDSKVTMGGMIYELAGIGLYQYQRSGTAAANLKENIQMIWGLNLQDCIKSVYRIPKEVLNYLSAIITMYYTVSGQVPRLDLEAPWKDVRISLANLYTSASGYDYVERQAIAKFGKLLLASETSGENKTFDLTDVAQILDGSATNDYVDLQTTADFSPGGKTYIKPKTFQGRTNTYFKNTVAGTPWLSQPVELSGMSGYMVSEGQKSLENQLQLENIQREHNTNIQNATDIYNAQLQGGRGEYFANAAATGLSSVGRVTSAIFNSMDSATGPATAYKNYGVRAGAATGLGAIANLVTPFGSQYAEEQMYNAQIGNMSRSTLNSVVNQTRANLYAQKELSIVNNIVAPTILFNRDPGIANYVKNGFYIAVVGLSQVDVDIFRRHMNFNGVAVCQPFKINTNDNFTQPAQSHPYAYYKFESVKIKKGTIPSIIGDAIQSQLYNGIRICGS